MIESAIYTSVWDDATEIESSCKVNTDTKEVFDIEIVDVSNYDIDVLTREYITFASGAEFDLGENDSEYWREE